MPPRPLAQRLELVRLRLYGVCCSHGCLWVVHRNPEPSSDGGGELLLMAVWVEGERRDRTGWKDRKRGEPDKL